jgi:hypothetical protein
MSTSSPHRLGTTVDRAGADGICFRHNTWHDTAMKNRRLHGACRVSGFRPARTVRGIFGDSKARVLRLTRRGKTICGTYGTAHRNPLLPHAPPSPRSLLATYGWARRYFARWQDSLQGEALAPFEKFAAMVQRNWDGIAACCRAEEKVSLGLVGGLSTKIRFVQRRAYGLRDEEYLRLTIPTCHHPLPSLRV